MLIRFAVILGAIAYGAMLWYEHFKGPLSAEHVKLAATFESVFLFIYLSIPSLNANRTCVSLAEETLRTHKRKLDEKDCLMKTLQNHLNN